jgi:hypothetical protein
MGSEDLGVVVANIIVTKVIGKDEDDVRRRDIFTRYEAEDTEKEQCYEFHCSTQD